MRTSIRYWNYRLFDDGTTVVLIEAYYNRHGRVMGWCTATPTDAADPAVVTDALKRRVLTVVDVCSRHRRRHHPITGGCGMRQFDLEEMA